MEERPVGGGDRRARSCARSVTPASGELAPLLLHLLALVVVERREEVGEVAVAGVVPVELHARGGSIMPARSHSGGFVVGREQHVQRRVRAAVAHAASARVEQRARASAASAARAARGPGRRRERDRGEELRVVAAAVAAVGVGPGPVEHVLAVGVRLRVQRQRADQRVAAPRGEVARRASPSRGDAQPVSCSAREERVRQQRLARRERVPLRRRESPPAARRRGSARRRGTGSGVGRGRGAHGEARAIVACGRRAQAGAHGCRAPASPAMRCRVLTFSACRSRSRSSISRSATSRGNAAAILARGGGGRARRRARSS